MALHRRLQPVHWRWLEPNVPDLGDSWNWDIAERLRRAFWAGWARNTFEDSPALVVSSGTSDRLLRELLRTAKAVPSARTILSQLPARWLASEPDRFRRRWIRRALKQL